jgi:hypothetical protein
MSRTTRVECPLTGQKFSVEPDEWNEPAFDEQEDETVRPGWGELVLHLCLPNPAHDAVLAQREALMQRIVSEGGSEIPVEVARAAVDRDLPLPSELLRATWTVRDLSPDAMDTIRDALAAAGLMLELPGGE